MHIHSSIPSIHLTPLTLVTFKDWHIQGCKHTSWAHDARGGNVSCDILYTRVGMLGKCIGSIFNRAENWVGYSIIDIDDACTTSFWYTHHGNHVKSFDVTQSHVRSRPKSNNHKVTILLYTLFTIHLCTLVCCISHIRDVSFSGSFSWSTVL